MGRFETPRFPPAVTVRWSRAFWGLNLLVLVFFTLKPANERMIIYRYLYNEGERAPFTLYALEDSPYRAHGLDMTVYRSPRVSVITHASPQALSDAAGTSDTLTVFVSGGFEIPEALTALGGTWTREAGSLPGWLITIHNRFDINVNDWLSRVRTWTIYRRE